MAGVPLLDQVRGGLWKVKPKADQGNQKSGVRSQKEIEPPGQGAQTRAERRMSENNNRIIGCAWATAGKYIAGEGEILTTVHAIGVDIKTCGMLLSGKTFLRLVQAVKKWGKSRGAKRTLVHVTTGTNLKATDRLMRASGAVCVGGGYVV